MDRAFWEERWKAGRIGFHEGRANTLLERHLARLGPAGRVFVPLCGKAEDMAYLAAQGHEVLGIELVAQAVKDFFGEHGLTPTVEQTRALEVHRTDRITLLAGDVFELRESDVAGVTAVYDRAALVALPGAVRARYVDHLRSILPSGIPLFLVTFDYSQERMEGPPFAVGEEEVRTRYAGCRIEKLDERPVTTGRLASAGAEAIEVAWLVTLERSA
jgi:thiopurine S-methyltransferase